MFAICKDNSNTWENSLTKGKAYTILNTYKDAYGYPLISIKCDDGMLRAYRKSRFTLSFNK